MDKITHRPFQKARDLDLIIDWAAGHWELEEAEAFFSDETVPDDGVLTLFGMRPVISSIRIDQGLIFSHLRLFLMRAFAVSINLRMIATMATLAGFPARLRAPYLAAKSGLNRMATIAGM